MKPIIPKTYNDIVSLVNVRKLREYSEIPDETAENLYEMLSSGRLHSVQADKNNTLKLTFSDLTEKTIDAPFNTSGGDIDAITLSRAAFRLTYSEAYLASHRSSSSSDSGGSSSNNNNNNNNNNNH